MATDQPQPTRISPTITLYPPSSTCLPTTTSSSPRLIILTAWIDAPPKAISKFVSGYHNLFPHANIYVVKIKRKEFVWDSYATILPSLTPLVEVLKQTEPKHVLLATYSNGGLMKTALLAEGYLAETGKPLTPHRMLMDSCPDKEKTARIVHAAQFGFPRFFGIYYPLLAFAYGVMYIRTAWMTITGNENVLDRSARIVNDKEFVGEEVPRCYVYSKTDRTIDWRDLVEHVKKAEEKGLGVQVEEFQGSGHVEHMRVDELRYWRLVKTFWEEGGNEKEKESMGQGKRAKL